MSFVSLDVEDLFTYTNNLLTELDLLTQNWLIKFGDQDLILYSDYMHINFYIFYIQCDGSKCKTLKYMHILNKLKY
jgi:hypothetical protein